MDFESSPEFTSKEQEQFLENEGIKKSDDQQQYIQSDKETQTDSDSENINENREDKKPCFHVDLLKNDYWLECIANPLHELTVVNIEAGIEELSVKEFVKWVKRSIDSWDKVRLCSSENYSSSVDDDDTSYICDNLVKILPMFKKLRCKEVFLSRFTSVLDLILVIEIIS